MNTLEEQLWNYIDGNCTPEEKIDVETKIAVDSEYGKLYREFLAVNHELSQLDLEEPSMSFTRNVMDKVILELKPVALKTKIDHRIVYGISAFFALSIIGLFAYAVATSSANFNFKLPTISFDFGSYINASTIQVFLLVDVALGLLYLDSFLRGNVNAQKKDS